MIRSEQLKQVLNMIDSMMVYVWAGAFRMAQAFTEAAPTMLFGVLTAAVFSHMLGPARTAKLFGEGTKTGLLRAWLMGMLLPVCSLGIFPVIREMRKSGISGGTILAFALSGPLFNPLSFLYGLTLSEPLVILSFAFASLVVVTIAGIVWDRLFPNSALQVIEEPPPIPYGLKRLFGVLVAASQIMVSPVMGYCLLALLGVGLLGAFVPFGSLEHTMKHNDLSSPLLMAAIATPAYVSPMRAMMQLGLLFEHGNSVGAGLTLLILGAGANIGLIAWLWRQYGLIRMLAWMGLLLSTVLAFSYLLNTPLDFATNRENHTHAFDEFSSPFTAGTSSIKAQEFVWHRLKEKVEVPEIGAMIILALLATIGLILIPIDKRWPVEGWLRSGELPQASDPSVPFWNRPLSTSTIATIAIGGLIIFSVIGCFLYYPDAETMFEEIRKVKVEVQSAVLLSNKDHAIRMIPKWDDLTRKLEVGVFLRRWQLDASAHETAEKLRETMEELRDAFREGTFNKDDIPVWNKKLEDLHRSLRQSLLSPTP